MPGARFNLFLGNHGGNRIAVAQAATVRYWREMLSACGHEVVVTMDELRAGEVNLCLEYFPGTQWADGFAQARAASAFRLGIVATELMVSSGGRRTIPYARHGIAYEAGPQSGDAMTEARLAGLDAVLPHADFFWAGLRQTVAAYERDARHAAFMPVGCIDLVPPSLRRAPKDVDVVFFGRRTPHRAAVIGDLQAAGLKVVAVGAGFERGWLPEPLVESLLDRARIGLNLTLHAADDAPDGTDPRFVSGMRVLEMFSRGVCVVSEEIPLENPYAPYMTSAPVQALADACRRILDEGGWRARGEANAERFRAEMDVRRICAPVVEDTLRATG